MPFFSVNESTWGGSSTNAYRVETADCGWSWLATSDGELTTEQVQAPDHLVVATSGFERTCGEVYYRAAIDGVAIGPNTGSSGTPGRAWPSFPAPA